jgi:hypothetical protein
LAACETETAVINSRQIESSADGGRSLSLAGCSSRGSLNTTVQSLYACSLNTTVQSLYVCGGCQAATEPGSQALRVLAAATAPAAVVIAVAATYTSCCCFLHVCHSLVTHLRLLLACHTSVTHLSLDCRSLHRHVCDAHVSQQQQSLVRLVRPRSPRSPSFAHVAPLRCSLSYPSLCLLSELRAASASVPSWWRRRSLQLYSASRRRLLVSAPSRRRTTTPSRRFPPALMSRPRRHRSLAALLRARSHD